MRLQRFRREIYFLLATAVYVFLFSRHTDLLSGDAQLSATLSNYQLERFGRSLSLRSDFLFGTGGLQGGFLFWLEPASVFGSIGSSVYNNVAVAVACSFIIFLLAKRLFLNLDVTDDQSFWAACLVSITTIWGYSIALVDNELFGHVPQYASLMIASLAILVSFTSIGRGRTTSSLWILIGFVLLVVYLFVALPHLLITCLPLLISVGLSSVLTSILGGNKSAGLLRLATFVFLVALLVVFDAQSFLLGFYGYTAASEIPLTAYRQPELLPIHEFLFGTYFPSPSARGNYLVQIAAFVGLSFYFFRGVFAKNFRNKVWIALAIAATFLLGYRLWQTTWDFESGPRINYFVWMLSPLYSVALVSVIFNLRKPLGSILRSVFRDQYIFRKIAGVAVLLAVLVSPLTSLTFSIGEPEARSLEGLRVEARNFGVSELVEGENFPGRLAFVLSEPDYPSNILRRTAILNEYSHLLSPAAFTFYSRFLLEDSVEQLRNRFIFGVKGFDEYRMIGVRYLVLPTQEVGGLAGVLESEGLSVRTVDEEFSILDLGYANTGGYSPVEVMVADLNEGVFEIVSSADFDPRKYVVFDSPMTTSLVEANDFSLRPQNGDLRVKGKSEGVSMLLLPLEYSSCLEVDQLKGSKGFFELRRANGLLTALIFDREIDVVVKLRFGLFENPTCRLDDLREFRRLNG